MAMLVYQRVSTVEGLPSIMNFLAVLEYDEFSKCPKSFQHLVFYPAW